jgi:predicted Zn-ribbon and HTH transcriptional regulator
VGAKYQAKIPELISNPATNIYQSQNHHSQHSKKKSKKLKYIPLECSDPVFEVKSNSQEVKSNPYTFNFKNS